MPGYGPPPGIRNDQFKVPPPKHWREIPAYLRKTIGGTFYRLFYIFRLVWETKPWMLLFMAFITVKDIVGFF